MARTAAQHGARILTRVGASNATGTSVTLTDQRSGESFDVSARAVINAAGVWAGEVDKSIQFGQVAEHIWCSMRRRSAIPLPR